MAESVEGSGTAEAVPRLSVLTPSFNYARFLGTAIKSVELNRSAIEHVVVDGGSADGTLEVLRAHPNVRWVSEPDRGQSDALNKALDLSRGEYVAWLNADDFYLPGALDDALAFMDANPGADVMHGDVAFVDGQGRLERLLAGYEFPLNVLRWRGCVIPTTATVFRRSILGDAPFDVDLRMVMDWDLYLRLKGAGARFAYRRGVMAAFRRHEEQVTFEDDDRFSPEQLRVRERWGAAPKSSQLFVHLGDWYHRYMKLRTGAWFRERAAKAWLGDQLLDEDGELNLEVCRQVLLESKSHRGLPAE